MIEKAEKKGFHTGLFAEHPLIEGHKLPVYVANFVLMDYGSGAVFGCPAHDQRDLDFANAYGLPVIPVVRPKDAGEDFAVVMKPIQGLACYLIPAAGQEWMLKLVKLRRLIKLRK